MCFAIVSGIFCSQVKESLQLVRLRFLDLKMEAGRQVFSVDLLERYAAKGRGVITCMAAGNDVILLGTSKGWIIRHDFGVGDSYGMLLYILLCMVPSYLFPLVNQLYKHYYRVVGTGVREGNSFNPSLSFQSIRMVLSYTNELN